jgi:phenylalanyl-tRNA synthetase beta chain
VRIPYEWLKEFVVLNAEPHELARRLTMRGLEVESIEEQTPSFDRVVIGKILKIDKHPHAQNLSICNVDIGRDTFPIACGAKNIKKGDMVPVAIAGAQLADGITIERKDIKGVESIGMLCSEKELGLSDDHSGIFILPDSLKVGDELKEASWIKDVVFDINVAPNRGDLLSIYGIAREVGSIFNRKATVPSFKLEEKGEEDIKEYIKLDVLNKDACPRYVLRIIKGISIVSSPYWMRSRIMKCGMRPINSIVDVTNYVMLEFGQPLHAFDYDMLRGRKIEVKLAEGETVFRTLDGEDRKLNERDILICDGAGPVAIAGIMGGENSEITENTKNVALESAFFNPLFIRQTARRLGLRSEASLRFEKGIDIDNVDLAAKRAISLMNQLSGGTVIKGKKEVREEKEKKSIYVSFGKINEIVGTTIERNEIMNALKSIELEVMNEEENGLLVSIPSFRHDLNEYMDLIEEVARIYGYEHVPATTPVTTLQAQKRDKKDIYSNEAKDYFRSSGFFELINYAFSSVKDIENFLISASDERASYVNIMNPISKDYGIMRTFITAGILKSIAYNINRGVKNLRFFEMGKVFFSSGEGLPYEYPAVCFALTGKERDYFWRDAYSEYDFFDIKGILEGLMERFGLDFSINRSEEPFLNSNRAADIFMDEQKIGWIGEIKEEVLKTYEIEQKVYCAELRFDIIIEKGSSGVKYRQIPRYPQVTRDFSFYIDDKIPVSTLIESIKRVSPLITTVGVFDMFKKEARSISLRVVFQSFEDTLKDGEVNNLQEIIIKELTNIEGVTLRT